MKDGVHYLSHRKQKLVKFLVAGLNPKEIGGRLGIAESTVYANMRLPLVQKMVKSATQSVLKEQILEMDVN